MIVGCCCSHKNKQKCVSRGSPAPLADCQLSAGQRDWPELVGTGLAQPEAPAPSVSPCRAFRGTSEIKALKQNKKRYVGSKDVLSRSFVMFT